MSNNKATKKSNILQQVVKINRVNKNEATHFALCNGKQIRYLICLNRGRQHLKKNISSYSNKLGLLMKFINIVPFSFLKIIGMGYFVNLKLHPAVEKYIKQTNGDGWNMIVGTYDEKQKLVIQSYRNEKELDLFIKIGNKATNNEMKAEICFLNEKIVYNSFQIPEILDYKLADDECVFNFLLTKEFVGEKVKPGITKDIVQIYKELSSTKNIINKEEYEFSHGDFAPWNIRKNEKQYIVFDWEHCDMRIKGFDLMHYVVVSKVMLEGKELSQSIKESLIEIKQYIPTFNMDIVAFEEEYKKLRLE